MSDVVALKPTEANITWWINHFMPEHVLWWWDDSAIPKEPHTLRILNRADSRNDPVAGDITVVNAFHAWAMHRDVERILVDDGRWIALLADDERLRASELQVRFNRGRCIPRQRFGGAALIPESAMFDGRVVLDQSLWASLPKGAKRSLVETELSEWDRHTTFPLPETSAAHISEIANSFVMQDGVNCLSVTSFAITGEPDDLNQWMFPGAFSQVLENAGYELTGGATWQKDDVVVFRDDENFIVHAAYVIAPNRLLNKNGQTSFNPIAITDPATLQSEWSDYTPAIYRR